MELPAAASVPDLRAFVGNPGLRRVQSERSTARSPPPLLRIRTERIAIEREDGCRGQISAPPPSPLRRMFSRLGPLSLHAELHEWPVAPEASTHRELSIVLERRGRSHRSRVTVTADWRLVRALAWFALLTATAAMSAAAVQHARLAIAPGAASAFQGGAGRRLLAPAAAEAPWPLAPSAASAASALASACSAGAAAAGACEPEVVPASAFAGRSPLQTPPPQRPPPAFVRQRAAVCRRARLSLLAIQQLHAVLLGGFSSPAAPGGRAAARAHHAHGGAARPAAASAAASPVAWAGGRSRARRLALGRHARRLAFELEPAARELGCAALLAALSEASCALLLPEAFRSVREWHSANLAVSSRALSAAEAALGAALRGALPAGSFEVAARSKSRASVFDKAVLRGKAVGDLLAARVILDDGVDCDAARAVVARLWPEEVGRRKDYVAQPKPNGYQSVHMTVRLPCGRPLEVQIRTRSMHAAAARGSARWGAYKSEACSAGPRRAGAARAGSGGSWARALDEVRCLQALQPERLRETLACAAGALPRGHSLRQAPRARQLTAG